MSTTTPAGELTPEQMKARIEELTLSLHEQIEVSEGLAKEVTHFRDKCNGYIKERTSLIEMYEYRVGSVHDELKRSIDSEDSMRAALIAKDERIQGLENQLKFNADTYESYRRALWHDVAVSRARSPECMIPGYMVAWADEALAAYDKQFNKKESVK